MGGGRHGGRGCKHTDNQSGTDDEICQQERACAKCIKNTAHVHQGGGCSRPCQRRWDYPRDRVELLGVTFNQTLMTRPHKMHVEDADRLCSSLVARLGHHLPQGRYLRQLSTGLILGKISHALPAVASPRLVAEDKEKGTYRSVQTAVNDVARTITEHNRKDHVTGEDLLMEAKLPTVNFLVTTAVAMEAWTAFHSSDGNSGGRYPLGKNIFGRGSTSMRTSRASAAGKVLIALRGADTLVTHTARVWNECPDLRVAASKADARRAARLIAATCPT
jgi:hypothetical protein